MADAEQREEHTTQGRWISPDPAGMGAVSLKNPQSWNRYAYADNNPLVSVDPSGLGADDASAAYSAHEGDLVYFGGNAFASLCYCTAGESSFTDFVNTNLAGVDSGVEALGGDSLPLSGNMQGASLESQSVGGADGASGSWDGPQMLSFGDLWNTSAGHNIEAAFAHTGPGGMSTFIMNMTMLTAGGTGKALAEPGVLLARRLGLAGEEAAGITGAKVGIKIPGSGVTRFPDKLTSTTLLESKNVAYQAFTQQLRDYQAYTQANGLRFDLMFRYSTKLSGPLQEQISLGRINLLNYPGGVIPGIQ